MLQHVNTGDSFWIIHNTRRYNRRYYKTLHKVLDKLGCDIMMAPSLAITAKNMIVLLRNRDSICSGIKALNFEVQQAEWRSNLNKSLACQGTKQSICTMQARNLVMQPNSQRITCYHRGLVQNTCMEAKDLLHGWSCTFSMTTTWLWPVNHFSPHNCQ